MPVFSKRDSTPKDRFTEHKSSRFLETLWVCLLIKANFEALLQASRSYTVRAVLTLGVIGNSSSKRHQETVFD